MEAPPAPPNWNTYADRFSTLESANASQPGHLSLEAAYRNVDDTNEGKEVYEAPLNSGGIAAHRVCGIQSKWFFGLGFLVLLFVIGGVTGGILGSRKKGGDEGSGSLKGIEESTSMLPITSTTSSDAAASKSTDGGSSSTPTVSSKFITSTSAISTSTSDTSIADTQTLETTPTALTTTTSTSTSRPEPVLSDFNSSKLYTFRSPGVKSDIAVDPSVFYYIRAAPKPGSQNLTVDTATNSNTPNTHWRIVPSSSGSELCCSTTAQTYWISNAIYGEGLILGLDKNDWANWQSSDTPVVDFPLQPKEVEDENQHWYFSKTGNGNATRYRMLNLGASSEASGMRVVMTVQGWLGVMDEVMQPKSVSVDEWEIQEVE